MTNDAMRGDGVLSSLQAPPEAEPSGSPGPKDIIPSTLVQPFWPLDYRQCLVVQAEQGERLQSRSSAGFLGRQARVFVLRGRGAWAGRGLTRPL